VARLEGAGKSLLSVVHLASEKKNTSAVVLQGNKGRLWHAQLAKRFQKLVGKLRTWLDVFQLFIKIK